MDQDRQKWILVRRSILVDPVHRRGDRPVQRGLADRLDLLPLGEMTR